MSNPDVDHAAAIEQFAAITDCDASRARFFLEAANWNVDQAVTQYFDSAGEDADMDVAHAINESVQQRSDSPEIIAETRPSAVEKPKFATLFSSKASAAAGNDNSESSDDETRQRYYVGGGEKSGQEVLAPRKPKDIVENLFAKAKEHGGQEVDAETEARAATSSQRSAFTGHGHRLGYGEPSADSEPVLASSVGASGLHKPVKKEPVKVVLKMWQQGISIDDGPLQLYDNPQTQRLMDSLKRGQIPPELAAKYPGQRIDLDMENHVQEEFVPPKVVVKPFQGAGHLLGAGASSSSSSGVPSAPVPSAATAATAPSLIEAKTDIDTSKPVTSVQVRLADGIRLVIKLNHDAKVSVIRDVIIRERPDMAVRIFALFTGFPSKELTNEEQTLEEAKLLNSLINQRLK